MTKVYTIWDEHEYFLGLAFSSKEKAREYVNKAIADDPESFEDEEGDPLPNCEQLEIWDHIIIDEFELDPEFKSQLS